MKNYYGRMNKMKGDQNVMVGNSNIRGIIMLEADKNKRGDLFTRLTYDVFHALGFWSPQYDVQKAGREVDIILEHRTEKRIALVECKSQQEKIGGTDLNKFAGVLSLESGGYTQNHDRVVGYFVSKSGFTATAIQQEYERKKANLPNEIILMGPEQIVAELINGKMLCSFEKAIEAVNVSNYNGLYLCDKADLVASEYGWIWVLYFSECPQQAATHFAFVHADGKRLLNNLAATLIKKSKKIQCTFSNLIYIKAQQDSLVEKQDARSAYFDYLENELGEIQFEGMPTDKDAGAVKVKLENIFTPLHFIYENKNKFKNNSKSEINTVQINEILDGTVRAAVLAKPGGGKSTLIRRIALAYAFPDRRKRVKDGLPDRDLFPVYIRCRDLGNEATKSIKEIIGSIVNRAEITQFAEAFKSIIEDALQDKKVLLLIDGLDEISNEQHRISFVNQLRTFTATYPTVNLIVTSREAGFRAVAGTLAGYCDQYKIAALSSTDIQCLCLKWHEAILGKSDKTKEDADKVCSIILDDSRIVALAENPLLLTTLLFVKRWVGYLPTKKCQLYAEMIKLLLVTWNAVAHEKLDIDETEPQLAFVAYHMTLSGQQKITRDKLEDYIIAARKELPDILNYTALSPSRFIDQVEERSSLLIQYGLEENENGRLVPSYEFSHLSFQEYLTAIAITKSWISDADKSILEVISPHFEEDHWKEVIPMVAVLSGRQAKPIIENLIKLSKDDEHEEIRLGNRERSDTLKDYGAMHLSNCIASEVPMSAEILEQAIIISVNRREAINNIINSRYEFNSNIDVFETIFKSKYGSTYRAIIQNVLLNFSENSIYAFSEAWLDICRLENKNLFDLDNVKSYLESIDRINKISGALFMMHIAYQVDQRNRDKEANVELLNDIYLSLIDMLYADDDTSLYVASWCIAWSGYNLADLIPHEFIPKIYRRLIELWLREHLKSKIRRCVAWGLCSCCMIELRKENYIDIPKLKEMIESEFESPKTDFSKSAALFLGILLQLWTNEDILERIKSVPDHRMIMDHGDLSNFLKDCGYDYAKFNKLLAS